MSAGAGLKCFTAGFRLTTQAPLRRFLWLPPAVGLLVLIPASVVTLPWLRGLSASLVGALPDWLQWLHYLFAPLLWLIALIALAWLTLLVTAILCGPFLSILAARVEAQVGAGPAPVARSLVATMAHTLLRELRKILWYLPRALALLVLTVIPGLTPVVAPLAWLFAAWVLALQFTDLSFENHDEPFAVTRAALWDQRWQTLGFAIPTALLMGIPIINLLALAPITAGATLLSIETRHPSEAR